jgi:hypothetical protein
MRSHLSLLLLATLLATGSTLPARAGTVSVDTLSRTVETSRLLVQFDSSRPEVIDRLLYKDYSPTASLTAYYVDDNEFWGETLRNTSSPGFISGGVFVSASWTVTQQSATAAEITISSQTSGQPPVVTRYHFVADQPWFLVYRTVRFSVLPDTAAYQAYLPRVSFVSAYHAARWRDSTGTVVQRGYCVTPCLEGSWNGHWVEQMAYVGPHAQFGVTSYFPASMPPRTKLVDGYGPSGSIGWVSPIVSAGNHTQDETATELIGFTTSPDNYARQDSMWTVYTSGVLLVDVPEVTGAPPLGLGVAPNPAREASRITWSAPHAGPYALDVLDVSGRRVTTLQAGWAPAGARSASWSGRDERGAPVAPGLYFARLHAAGRTSLARMVRVR